MGWLEEYLVYTEEQESPAIFHLWSAIAVLGHVLGRRCWLNRGGKYKIYPGQIMVLLVARSAIARKSTAVRMAADFLQVLPDWAVHRLPSKLSPQQYIQSTESIKFREGEGTVHYDDPFGRPRDCCGLIVADELGTFLTVEDFARALPTHICDFNDAPLGTRLFKFRGWEANVYNPCTGMIAATTVKGVAKELPDTVRQAGFWGRLLTVFSDPNKKANPLTETTKEDTDRKVWLSNELTNRIAYMHGKFRWSKQGKEEFEQFYYKFHEWAKTHVDTGVDSEDTGYWGRKADHLLRVAMVLSSSESSGQVLCQRHIRGAMKYLRVIEKSMSRAFMEVGVHRNADIERRVLALLDRHDGWVPRWRLAASIRRYGDKRSRDAALESLVESKEIEVERVGNEVCIKRRRKKQ